MEFNFDSAINNISNIIIKKKEYNEKILLDITKKRNQHIDKAININNSINENLSIKDLQKKLNQIKQCKQSVDKYDNIINNINGYSDDFLNKIIKIDNDNDDDFPIIQTDYIFTKKNEENKPIDIPIDIKFKNENKDEDKDEDEELINNKNQQRRIIISKRPIKIKNKNKKEDNEIRFVLPN